MEHRRLGLAGIHVSEVGLGTNTIAAPVDQKGTMAIIDVARELGVNFIDSAESYSNGESEAQLGTALGARRRDFVIATKTGARNLPPGRLSRREITSHIDASLKRLRTDWIDVYYLHAPDQGTPLEETLRALDDAVSAGKILYPAVSNFAAWQIAEVLGICTRSGFAVPVVTQSSYNLLDRGAEAELIPACAHFGVSLVPYFPLAGGFLTGKYRRGEPPPPGYRGYGNLYFARKWLNDQSFDRLQRLQSFAAARDRPVGDLAIAWLLAEPVVCSVIAGVTSPEQLAANVRAAEWRLTTEEKAELAAL
jgi:aryl-alcohol dehydrogenase-like predicted oxidoreductase